MHFCCLQIQFKSEIYGTFRQTVVFDYGSEPVLQRQLCVESTLVTDMDQLDQDLRVTETSRWDVHKIGVVEFEPKYARCLQ